MLHSLRCRTEAKDCLTGVSVLGIHTYGKSTSYKWERGVFSQNRTVSMVPLPTGRLLCVRETPPKRAMRLDWSDGCAAGRRRAQPARERLLAPSSSGDREGQKHISIISRTTGLNAGEEWWTSRTSCPETRERCRTDRRLSGKIPPKARKPWETTDAVASSNVAWRSLLAAH